MPFLTPNLPPPLQALLSHLHPLPPPSALPSPPPPSFRIHAWRWHHLSLESSLSSLASLPPTTPLAQLHTSLSHISATNWDIHDHVESLHLAALTPLPPSVASSRARLRSMRTRLLSDLSSASPSLSPADASRRIRSLCVEARAAFAESEAAVVPAVAALPREAQDAFNRRVVRDLGQGRARVALTWFYSVLFGGARAGACGKGDGAAVRWPAGAGRVTQEDRKVFRRAIPAPVRALLPVWEGRMRRKYPELFGG